jgi:hypothetical protein
MLGGVKFYFLFSNGGNVNSFSSQLYTLQQKKKKAALKAQLHENTSVAGNYIQSLLPIPP